MNKHLLGVLNIKFHLDTVASNLYLKLASVAHFLFRNYILSTLHISGTMLGPGNKMVHSSLPWGSLMLVGKNKY